MQDKKKKKEIIAFHFKEIMETLGLDLNNDSLKGTPERVAKMYVDEIFCGLTKENYPRIMSQKNEFKYDQMLIEKRITVKSVCEHHFVPIIGFAHVAYIPNGRVIGLSKLNRIVEYWARRPQVQERLTQCILNDLQDKLKSDDVAVVIDAEHFCVSLRGVQHQGCVTRTSALGGSFKTHSCTRKEFFNSIGEIR